MIVGVPSETYPNENRVALIPAVISALVKLELEVHMQKGAGEKAGYLDADYEKQGAKLISDRAQIFSSADVLLGVNSLGAILEADSDSMNLLRSGQVIIGLLNPLGSPEYAQKLAAVGVDSFALELLPRIARAQPMDVLSSMASIAGYKSVLLSAEALNKLFPMMITAAGTITPAHVFVVGVGVAGLQAIATAKRLGAVIRAYDVRPAVKEQVESLGAKFVEMELETEESETSGGYAKAMDEDFYRRQREMMTQVVAESDVVITTALIPGKKAPILITEEMVKGMSPGSVIVDLAAEGGGNCELTKSGETIEAYGVKIIGIENLASTIPHHASQMYSKNLAAFLNILVENGELNINMDDDIIKDTLLTYKGEVFNPRVKELLGTPNSKSTDERSDS